MNVRVDIYFSTFHSKLKSYPILFILETETAIDKIEIYFSKFSLIIARGFIQSSNLYRPLDINFNISIPQSWLNYKEPSKHFGI